MENHRLCNLYFDSDIESDLKHLDENFEDLNFNDMEDVDAFKNKLYYFTDSVDAFKNKLYYFIDRVLNRRK